MPDVDLTAAMGAMGDWLGVAPQLARLVASSRTGAQVFGFAADLTQSEVLKGEVRAWLERVVASGYAREEIEKAAKACAHAAGSRDLAKCLTKKREVVVQFCGMEASVQVHDARGEWDVRFAAQVKDAALGRKGGLALLPYERWSAADSPAILAEQICQVHGGLLPGSGKGGTWWDGARRTAMIRFCD